MLEYFDNKFTNSSIKVKIELYLLPLILLYFSYYFFINENQNLKFEIVPKIDLNEYLNKKFTASYFELFTKFEEYSQKNNIFIHSINKEKNGIKIKANGTQNSIVNLINNIENSNNFTKITLLNLNKKNNSDEYLFDLDVDLSRFFIKEFKKIEAISENQKNLFFNNIKNNDYKLTAIIQDYAFINEIWVKKDEKIDDFKLVKIDRNYILLENKAQKIKLELENEQYLKNLN